MEDPRAPARAPADWIDDMDRARMFGHSQLKPAPRHGDCGARHSGNGLCSDWRYPPTSKSAPLERTRILYPRASRSIIERLHVVISGVHRSRRRTRHQRQRGHAMTLVNVAPFSPHPFFTRSDVHLWHLDLPARHVEHSSLVVTSPAPPAAVASRMTSPLPDVNGAQLARIWRNVPVRFVDRVRRYPDRRRLCPLCSPSAGRRYKPRYSDLP